MPRRIEGFDPTIFKARPAFYYAIVLAMRFIRLVVVVPFIEEIFWRGFLLRYLVKEDFESVPRDIHLALLLASSPSGFAWSTSLPITRPRSWPGALFNLVAYRTRSLSSCVLAHSVANFLLGIYIMRTGQWGFW